MSTVLDRRSVLDRTEHDAPSPVAASGSPHRPRAWLGIPLRPGWPLTGLLMGYPVWWLLGFAEVMPLVAATIMAVQLSHKKRLVVSRGFGWWLVFLAWVLIGVVVLQVNTPELAPGGGYTRYLTFGYRVLWYLAATVVVVYVANMRKELSNVRITRAFGWFFITVVAGGVIGTLYPFLDFPSLIELVLPRGISGIPFIHDMIHPVVAQLYSYVGVLQPRASSPFPYTNDWGLNFALLLPFFLMGWVGRDAGWRRRVAPIILAVAIYPVIESLNRGLWISLIAMVVFTAVRYALLGHARTLVGLVTATILIGMAVFSTSFAATIIARFNNGYSNTGRVNLSSQAVSVVSHTSPIVGLGTTRHLVGSFQSIAGAATSICPLCSPPSLGTQGHIWLVLFTTGLVGLLIYLGFFFQMIGRSLRIRSPYVAMALATLVAHLVTMLVYDTVGIALFAIFAAVGILWRESDQAAISPRWPAVPNPTLWAYFGLIREQLVPVAACLGLGVAAGGLWQYHHGVPTTATAMVELPRNPTYPGESLHIDTLDTLGQMLKTPSVVDAVTRAVGRPMDLESELTIGAAPNSRILYVKVTDVDGPDAAAAATAAARQLVKVRDRQLQRHQQLVIERLKARERGLLRALTDLDRRQAAANAAGNDRLSQLYVPIRFATIARHTTAHQDTATVLATRPTSGTVFGPAQSRERGGVWRVSLASGLMVGFLVALQVARIRQLIGRKVGRGDKVHAVTGLDVVATVPMLARSGATGSAAWRRELAQHATILRAYHPSACVSASDDLGTKVVADEFDKVFELSHSPIHGLTRHDVLVVASTQTRLHTVVQIRDRLQESGARVVGLIVTTPLSGTAR